jgi:CubicO group peptidase (beta-lactamase class C family)
MTLRRFLVWVLPVAIAATLALILVPRMRGPERRPMPDYWPTHGWRSTAPEEQGIDSGKLAEGLLAIREKQFNIHSLLIIRNGLIVLDAYFYPYDGKTFHELASVTKSIMTTLIGIAADQGKLKLDQPMLSFFPDLVIANRDSNKKRVTARHLASMCSGLDSVGLERDEGTLNDMRAAPDWVQFAIDRKVVHKPGRVFVYDSPGMHLLSAILQKATGMTAFEYARSNLFEPLGIHDVIWPKDPQGFTYGWGDVCMHPRDAAKLGYLWINNGVWEEKQIVSREWVESSVKPQIKTDGDDYYGYGWWITVKDKLLDYSAVGRGGQYIKVIPYLDMVIVATGGGFDFDDIEPLIAPALIDASRSLHANPGAVDRLSSALKTIQEPPAPRPVAPLPKAAEEVSGKTFVFGPNPFQLKTLRLEFNDSAEAGMQLTFADDQPPRSGKIGLDAVYRMSPGKYNLPVGQRGYWADAYTFVLEYDEVANRDARVLRLVFEDKRVMIEAKERSHEAVVSFEGKLQ